MVRSAAFVKLALALSALYVSGEPTVTLDNATVVGVTLPGALNGETNANHGQDAAGRYRGVFGHLVVSSLG